MSRYRIPHGWRFPIFLGALVALAFYAWITKPEIEDLIDVRSIRVVALDPGTIVWGGGGCVTQAQEKETINAGDRLFVKPDIWFLGRVEGQYRTKLRNVTVEHNVHDIVQWSQSNIYNLGKAYCTYHPLAWWMGLPSQPDVRAGAYVLITEYLLHPSPNRAVPASFSSKPFVVHRPIRQSDGPL